MVSGPPSPGSYMAALHATRSLSRFVLLSLGFAAASVALLVGTCRPKPVRCGLWYGWTTSVAARALPSHAPWECVVAASRGIGTRFPRNGRCALDRPAWVRVGQVSEGLPLALGPQKRLYRRPPDSVGGFGPAVGTDGERTACNCSAVPLIWPLGWMRPLLPRRLGRSDGGAICSRNSANALARWLRLG